MDSWVVNKKHTGGRRKKNAHIINSNSIINHATHKGGRRNTQLGGDTETNRGAQKHTGGGQRNAQRGDTENPQGDTETHCHVHGF